MGAGHDGAAREMAARLRSAGHPTEVRDFLDAIPLRLGGLMRKSYVFEIKRTPRLYDNLYRVMYKAPWLCSLLAWLSCLMTRRKILRWARRTGAEVVVSTYPFATLCLGRLRMTGRLRVPTVNFITDFGVHPLWVHKGVDLNLTVHPVAAEDARRQTGRLAVACGPLIGPAYDPSLAASATVREEARHQLGLDPADRAVLIVAGSLGLGRVERTVVALAGTSYVPVVVCGRDEVLRARVKRRADEVGSPAITLGWTDRMPQLMAACDALVENAGGLTSLEAMRIGLPVVSYEPIPGHGRENTAAMAEAGVSALAADRSELLTVLDAVTRPSTRRDRLVAAGQSMFTGDGATLVAQTGNPEVASRLGGPSRLRLAWASASRRAVGLFAVAAIGWGLLTTGVGVAVGTSHVGAARPEPYMKKADVVYVGIRLNVTDLRDRALVSRVQSLGVSVIVDQETADKTASVVRRLAHQGVDVENGGHGLWYTHDHKSDPALWTRANKDAKAGATLTSIIGKRVTLFVPGRRVNAFDLLYTTDDHEKLVVPDLNIDAAKPPKALPQADASSIVLVDGLEATPAQLLSVLNRLTTDLTHDQLLPVPLMDLR